MSYHYTIHPADNVVVVTASGRVVGEEVIASVEAMARDPRFVAGMHQLCDYREIQGIAITLAEIKHLAHLERRDYDKIKDGRLAMVTGSFDVSSLCVLYATLIRLRGRQAKVFRSIDEAYAWLGLPEAPVMEARAEAEHAG